MHWMLDFQLSRLKVKDNKNRLANKKHNLIYFDDTKSWKNLEVLWSYVVAGRGRRNR